MNIRSRKTVAFLAAGLMLPAFLLTVCKTDILAATISSSDVKIYALAEGYDEISVPEGKATSYQLEAYGGEITSCKVKSGNSCDVTDAGLITARQSPVYNITTGQTYNRYNYGKSVVECKVGDEVFDVDVEVINYAAEYADGKVKEYLDENIKDGMTDREKLEVIARFPATFDYDYRYQSYTGMIIHGGGDCWASTNLIVKECTDLGIEAWSRNANRDPGAGSGHRNAMVFLNDKYYILEAGYSGKAPRGYNVTELNSPYSYTRSSDGDGVTLYSFDGKIKEGQTVLEIPEEIGGYKVTGIDKSFLHVEGIEEIVLPDTLESIGDFAFTACKDLLKINIPSSVSSIGYGIFAQADKVVAEVSPDNPNFVCTDGMILTKDGKELCIANSCAECEIPSTVEIIRPYAFYYNPYIRTLKIPSSVRSIGEGAFGNADKLSSLVFEGSSIGLGNFVFANTPSLNDITLPSGVTFTDATFIYAGAKNITMKGDAPVLPDETDTSRISCTFYVPSDSKGYDKGKWAELKVVRGVAPTPTPVPVPSVTSSPGPTAPVTSMPGVTAKPTSIADPTAAPLVTDKAEATVTPKATNDSRSRISDFVSRIYRYVLDRNPEEEGLKFWSDELYAFRRTGAEVGLQFIFSDEFTSRGTSDEEFVKILYNTFFDREPEADGLKFWTGGLKAGTLDRTAVAKGFIYSQEWADTCASYGIRSGGDIRHEGSILPNSLTNSFVERMYTTAMKRKSDPDGKKFWASALANFDYTGEQVGVMFFLSDEMEGFGLSDEEFVVRLYKTFMDRDPEKGGLDFWTGFLKDGGSRGSVVLGFTRSEEFIGKCIEARILPY